MGRDRVNRILMRKLLLKNFQNVFSQISIFFSLSLVLTSCLAFGVPYTSSPDKLIKYSHWMMDEGRPFPAKDFIDTAYKKFEEENDKKGLAKAYFAYARYHMTEFFIPTEPSLEPGPSKKGFLYQKNLDYDKSEGYFKKAIQKYEEINDHEGLARTHLAFAVLFFIRGDKAAGLNEVKLSDSHYKKTAKIDPDGFVRLERDKFSELISEARQSVEK